MRGNQIAKTYFNKNRPKKYLVRFYDNNGKRCGRSFGNQLDAHAFENQCNQGAKMPEILFSTSELLNLANIRELCKIKGIDFNDILGLFHEFINTKPNANLPIAPLIQQYLSNCVKRNMRSSTIHDYTQRLKYFLKDMGNINLGMLTADRLKSYFNSVSSPAHHKKTISAFFSFLMRCGYIKENYVKNISLPKQLKSKSTPSILTVEETKTLFNELPDYAKPGFALMAFLGVRPHEIVNDWYKPVVRWEDIDFKTRKIEITAEVAKTRVSRRILNAPENLWKWLEAYKRQSGNIYNRSYANFKRTKKKLTVKLPTDVLRHSFASYGYNALGIEKTVEIMGHEGGYNTYKTHYKAVTSKEDSEAFFKIFPD